MKKVLFLSLSITGLLLSCASQKKQGNSNQNLIKTNDAQEALMEANDDTEKSPLIGNKEIVSGILKKTSSGYSITHMPKSKNRVTYVIVAAENQEKLFDTLIDYVDKKVTVAGTITDAKNFWHRTLAVTALEK